MIASKTTISTFGALGSAVTSRRAALQATTTMPCRVASSFSTSTVLLALRNNSSAFPSALPSPARQSLQAAMQTRNLSLTPPTHSTGFAAPSSTSSADGNIVGKGKVASGIALDWNTFFKLRKARRRWQLLFSAAGFAGCGMTGAVMLANGVGGELLTQVPLDPMITMGLVTTSAASLGWLMGPSVGSRVFYWLNRQVTPQFMLKENNFFARIKRNRVDPSSSSAGNPVPDFYGEKISSVTGYRHWLKDQRAFNKKRTSFV
ncbi:Presequence translocated-associated motor subunit pam17, mitochondrial [Ceratocystis fimbriata CBS 114723]|uniref:Presequence translocated-associated motor subunit PAM17 n=1 Tax=Ceratocystis fimbriata CBS 114723 TaxID=1035309 RepID=A0A2C5XDN7_9PEZI|nr:Presequence translocated-associated motor subunit pam17, mitochondrial [Ceratocystis fimbriata CBS 114723]